MVEAAVVYLILAFPGNSLNVQVLPMADATTCAAEKAAVQQDFGLQVKYSLPLFALCVKSGLKLDQISN